jgi:hypothetical protein
MACLGITGITNTYLTPPVEVFLGLFLLRVMIKAKDVARINKLNFELSKCILVRYGHAKAASDVNKTTLYYSQNDSYLLISKTIHHNHFRS